MRKFAYLREPLPRDEGAPVVKIMLFKAEDGVYLFEYTDPDAVFCSADIFYDSLEDLYDEWNGRIDGRGWTGLADPLPGCQHDAFLPIRIKGRDTGTPEWGKFEIMKDGEWVAYDL
nr:hypothetical protein [Lachnospiraceae bacterium]